MVCDDVRRVAYFFLDGTLGESKRVDFESHLEDCGDCEARVIFHRSVRKFLKRRLRPIAAPPALRARVGTSLQTLRVSG